MEQYRNLGQYWSLGTDTETGEADRVSGRKIANDQTGEESGEQAESENRWSGQMENPIEEKPKIALTFDDGLESDLYSYAAGRVEETEDKGDLFPDWGEREGISGNR